MIYKEPIYNSIVQVHEKPYTKAVYKSCRDCGTPIIVKEFESFYTKYPGSMFSWKRHVVRSWYCAFNQDQPDCKHVHDICTDNDEPGLGLGLGLAPGQLQLEQFLGLEVAA